MYQPFDNDLSGAGVQLCSSFFFSYDLLIIFPVTIYAFIIKYTLLMN